MKFSISKAADGKFDDGGLRSFFEYRDLGIRDVTEGRYMAHVIRAKQACTDGTGFHRHPLDFQIFYVLKGTVRFRYDGHGEHDLVAGDCVHQPPGIRHELMSCSDDCEILEITSPAEFETLDA